MMETLDLNIDERGVASVELNRPDVHHAFNRTMIKELTEVMQSLAQDDAVRVIILRSEGPNFCAGGDLNWMREQADADRAGKISEAKNLAMMLKTIHDLPKPVICRVQGNSFGGGIGLMAVSDITIAADSARFALTETRLGLIPATIGPFVIARIGSAHARSVFVTGSVMTATRAQGLGLVSLLATPDELDDLLEKEVKTALAAAPGAMARAKALANSFTSPDLDGQINDAINALADCWETEETQNGITAFFAKSKAPWVRD